MELRILQYNFTVTKIFSQHFMHLKNLAIFEYILMLLRMKFTMHFTD